MRRAKTRMNAREILWEQAVARHRHENTRLAELEDEQNGSHASQGASTDQRLRPGLARERGCDRGGVSKID